MAQDVELDYFSVTIDGRAMPKDMIGSVSRIVVDQNLHLPAMFEIHLRDEQSSGVYRWIDRADLKIGSEIFISAEPVPEGKKALPVRSDELLIRGEVTAIECEFGESADATLIVRGYDRSHRLHLGMHTQTFTNMSDADIVRQVGEAAGLKVATTDTSVVHEYMLQNNQTDMAFLRARARRIGFHLGIDDDGQLTFRKVEGKAERGPELSWGGNLRSFRPTISAARQTHQVATFSWDPKSKQSVQSVARVADASPDGPDVDSDLEASRSIAGIAARAVMVDQPATVDECDQLAAAAADDVQSSFVEAEGTCLGHSAVKAGRTVTIRDVGRKFSGVYFVTSATHVYAPATGYRTTFRATGHNPGTLLNLLAPMDVARDGRISGAVIGVVTNNNDPAQLGRVKVAYPWLGDESQVESHWCRLASPAAGKERGLLFVPEMDDEVLVVFIHGDPNAPCVVGALWNGVDKPPKPEEGDVIADGSVNRRVIRSRSGHEVMLDDTPGKERIVIRDKKDTMIMLDAAKSAVTISAAGDVTLTCDNFTLSAKSDISIEGRGTVAVDGKRQVALNGSSLVVLP
jgi:phage protein D/phage baseplate assembly protein gpV